MLLRVKLFSAKLCWLAASWLAPVIAIASDGYPKATEPVTSVNPKIGTGLKAAIKVLKAIKKRNEKLRAVGKLNEIKYAIDLS